jgi:hypothetical protein
LALAGTVPTPAARRVAATALVALAAALGPLPAAEASTGHAARPAHPLQVGFGDSLFASEDPATREYWLGQAVATGASLARINVRWSAVAPKVLPPGFDPADPASPGYRWAPLDAAVRSAAAHGLRVMLTVGTAPSWAEGTGRPAGAPAGTWKPQPAAFAAFARALAARYSGRFADPLFPGATLPAVHRFEVWNEPNLGTYLNPQWKGRRSLSAVLYRGLVNAFYAGVKAVQPRVTVIAGSLAPFGDPPGGQRTPPVWFLREMLCLRGGRLKPIRCPRPARFDVLSGHPIAVGAPSESSRSPLGPLDVTTPDLGLLTRVLRRAEATGRALPRAPKPLWATEFWYDSSPPDPNGVPLYRQARWYEQDLYMFWKQGARAAIALELRDSPPGRGYQFTSQAGAFFLDGGPKPAQTAFRFPLVAHRAGRRLVEVWGIAPRPGWVSIEVRRGGRWVRMAVVRARARSRPFEVRLPLAGRVSLRARLGGEVSLVWKQG